MFNIVTTLVRIFNSNIFIFKVHIYRLGFVTVSTCFYPVHFTKLITTTVLGSLKQYIFNLIPALETVPRCTVHLG